MNPNLAPQGLAHPGHVVVPLHCEILAELPIGKAEHQAQHQQYDHALWWTPWPAPHSLMSLSVLWLTASVDSLSTHILCPIGRPPKTLPPSPAPQLTVHIQELAAELT